jgi:peptide/nickel transport system substrate-binding protein
MDKSRLQDTTWMRHELSRREALRNMLIGGAILAVPGVLAGCESNGSSKGNGQGSGGTNAQIKTLRWGNGEVTNLDIAKAWNVFAQAAMTPALETLVTYTSDLKLTPQLAKSYDRPDNLHYVYTIRDDVTFWDGTPMTADDVAFSLGRHLDPKVASALGGVYESVKSVDVTGDNEVTVSLKTPDPLFDYVVAFVHIIPRSFAKSAGKDLGAAGSKVNIMGTGPMKIVAYDETGVKYEANSAYWGEKSRVSKLELQTFTQPEAVRLAFDSGSIDGSFTGIATENIGAWKRLSGAKLNSGQALSVTMLSLNVTKKPFDDVHVRRAIAYATDSAGFVKAFQGGMAEVPSANTIVPSAFFGNLADKDQINEIYDSIPSYSFDLKKAKAELKKSQYPDGFKTEIEFPSSFPLWGKVLVSLSKSLKEIGIDLKPKSVPQAKYVASLNANDSALMIGGFGPDYPDPANYLTLTFAGSSAVPGRLNSAHFVDPRVDKLLEQQLASKDNAQRAGYLGEILKIGGEEVPYIPFWWNAPISAVNEDKFVYNDFNSLYYVQNWVSSIRATS